LAWNANAGVAATKACIAPLDDPFHESRIYAMMHVAIHDCGQRRGISSFDACDAGVDAGLGNKLMGELTKQREQNMPCRPCHCGIRRSASLHLPIERVRLKPTIDSTSPRW